MSQCPKTTKNGEVRCHGDGPIRDDDVGSVKTPSQHRIDEATARTLAVEAGVDPRTIKKVDRGEEVVGMAGERARAALARHRAVVSRLISP